MLTLWAEPAASITISGSIKQAEHMHELRVHCESERFG
jgi:hypothetical protein